MALADVPEPWVPQDTFAVRLAIIRVELGGWNIKKAAEFCGIEPENWRRWESGKSCRDMPAVARKIADRTGADYRWLMAGGPLRSTCFSPFVLVGPVVGQGELFDDSGVEWNGAPPLRAV